MKNLLVTLADKNYIDQAKQLFSSIYYNSGWQGDCMLLSNDIPEKELRWFRKRGILIKKCVPFYPEKVGINSITVFSKLYVFSEEFKKWKKIIFLDGDIIVRGSIDDLIKVEGFNAVRIINEDRHIFLHQFMDYDKAWLKRLKERFDVSKNAFNSGVMAFDTNIIKKNILNDFKEIIDEYKKIICISEETVLNIYFYDQWKELPAVYNICPNYETGYRNCRPEELKGRILHFYSTFFPIARKPWSKENQNYIEWNYNLSKADGVDFKKQRPLKKAIIQDVEKDSEFLLNLRKRYYLKTLIRLSKNRMEYRFDLNRKIEKLYEKFYRLSYKLKQNFPFYRRLISLFKRIIKSDNRS